MDVLFIEDNALRLAEPAFGSSPQSLNLHVVTHGVEANQVAQVVNSFLSTLAKFPSIAGKSPTLIFGGPEVR
jgi:hypothetical protein